MFPKRFRDPKTGFHLLSFMHVKKYMKNIGLEREDYYFLKQVGKALLCTYSIIGAMWLYNETAQLGWWRQKPRLKEEHEETLKEFIAKGRMIANTIRPKGMVENDKDGCNCQELQGKNFDEEAQKLWLKMRNDVVAELKEKGFDVE
ncbi:hypothetical protein VNO77_43254 [Canavalia gladiata]|uniref:Uncharacterized protein n=1 Tax=Canavalia gladiata TaxID=3824 RepID=A0AAN9JXE0_CANGL